MRLCSKTFEMIKELHTLQQGWLWMAGYKRRSGPQHAADEKSEMHGVLFHGMPHAVNLSGSMDRVP